MTEYDALDDLMDRVTLQYAYRLGIVPPMHRTGDTVRLFGKWYTYDKLNEFLKNFCEPWHYPQEDMEDVV